MFKIVLKATFCQLLWLKVAPILLSYHHLTSSSILLPRWRWGHTHTHRALKRVFLRFHHPPLSDLSSRKHFRVAFLQL